MFGYFVWHRGADCSLRDAGCEMLSLILELETC